MENFEIISDKEEAVVGTGVQLTDEEYVDLYRQFSLSQPIRIPVEKFTTDYEYRFINVANANVYQRRRGLGWEPVLAEDLDNILVPPHTARDLHLGTHVDAMGRVALGDDLVFAKLTTRHAIAIRAHHAKMNADRLKAGRNRFHQAGQLAGVITEDIPV